MMGWPPSGHGLDLLFQGLSHNNGNGQLVIFWKTAGAGFQLLYTNLCQLHLRSFEFAICCCSGVANVIRKKLSNGFIAREGNDILKIHVTLLRDRLT